jgi:cytochrome c oxidase accessory protein FixG
MNVTVEKEDASFRDRIPTVTAKGNRNWIYAWQPKGKLYTWRSILSVVYVVLFFSLPFISIRGNPALQLNVVEGKFSILGMIFWPQDFFIFGLAMVSFIVFIVLFTMIFGRVFCGWACPQTIFMEMIFRKIEWWIEGNPNQQRTLNAAAWTSKKIFKKTSKHIIFFILSFIIANTFLAYIIGKTELFKIITEPIDQHVGGFIAILFFTVAFYVVYAFIREIVCTVICPYGRLQGVLLDKNSVVVAYDYNRGEPRAKGKRPAENLGDCIDCHQCVNVCPTGIDIRNGTQLECVNCTACIDACNNIMEKIHLPLGLIRYASENELAEKRKFKITNKMVGYSIVLLVLLVSMAFTLTTRSDVEAKILRARGQLFQEVGTDSLSNLYNVMMVNKTHEAVPISLKLENMPGSIRFVGKEHMLVPKEGQKETLFFVVVNKKELKSRETELVLGIYQDGKKIKTIKTSFLGYVE